MKRAITTLGVLGLAAFAAAAPAAADRGGNNGDKVIVCHAGAGSNSGHFSSITVAVPSLNGHDEHGADIIPPTSGTAGQNWDTAGRAIYDNGCVVPGPVVPPVDPPAEEYPPVEPPAEEYPPVEPPAEEYPPVDPPAEEYPPVEPPAEEYPPVEPPAEEYPPVEPPVNENPPAGAPAAENPPAVQPVVENTPADVTPVPAVQNEAAPAAEITVATSRGTNQGFNAQTVVGGSDGAPSWPAGVGALLAAGAAVALRRKSRTLPSDS